jgi:hypothetical protein
MVYPRKCPGCGVLTDEDGFARDRYQPSGRKSRCRVCHRRDVKVYQDAVRKPQRLARLAAERAAEEAVLKKEWARRRKAAEREAEAGRRRQAKLLAELGVEDVSPEELSRRIRAGGGLYIRGS